MRRAETCVAGTASARACHGRHGLEARDRVGGRISTETRPSGTAIDRGGTWLGARHDAIRGLATEMRTPTHRTWVKGAHLLVGEGRVRRYTGRARRAAEILDRRREP